MKLQEPWNQKPQPFIFSMLSVGVTQCPPFMARERNQHGKHGLSSTATFTKLSSTPTALEDEDLQIIEEFVVLMYDRSSSYKEVNEARLDLFARKQRAYDCIPPTKASLREHCKRAAFQAGHIWSQSLICSPVVPSPRNWGWQQSDSGWLPHWTDLPAVAKIC